MSSYTESSGKGLGVKDIGLILKRRRRPIFITFVLMAIISVLLVVLIPATYLSKSTILIEQQEIPQELVRSTVTSYADQRIEVITQRVMTTSNLWDIITKYDLYKDELRRETRERVIEEMREDAIKRRVISAEVVDPRSGRPTEATIAFQISFLYEEPRTAQKVANELTSLFLDENLKSRSQMAQQASAFLNSEVARFGAEVAALEQALADFKEVNFDSLPELTDLNLNLRDRTEQALLDNQRQINLVKERISYLKSELSQIDPETPVLQGSNGALLSDSARLKALNNELVQAESRYAESHPTVQRLREELNSMMDIVSDEEAPDTKLKVYKRELDKLTQRYEASHPSVVKMQMRVDNLEKIDANIADSDTQTSADNPAYLQVKGQLESAQIELSGYVERANTLAAERDRYEERLTKSPRIEQEYLRLQRDYQTAALKYTEMQAKQQEASLGVSLESEQKGERFTLIEPPLVPEEPHSPNRALLAVLGVILTFGATAGIVVLLEMLDPSIRGRNRLAQAIGAPPLAVIPYITTEKETVKNRNGRIIFIVSFVVAIALGLTLFHLFIKPLDVTWFIAMRRFGFM